MATWTLPHSLFEEELRTTSYPFRGPRTLNDSYGVTSQARDSQRAGLCGLGLASLIYAAVAYEATPSRNGLDGVNRTGGCRR